MSVETTMEPLRAAEIFRQAALGELSLDNQSVQTALDVVRSHMVFIPAIEDTVVAREQAMYIERVNNLQPDTMFGGAGTTKQVMGMFLPGDDGKAAEDRTLLAAVHVAMLDDFGGTSIVDDITEVAPRELQNKISCMRPFGISAPTTNLLIRDANGELKEGVHGVFVKGAGGILLDNVAGFAARNHPNAGLMTLSPVWTEFKGDIKSFKGWFEKQHDYRAPQTPVTDDAWLDMDDAEKEIWLYQYMLSREDMVRKTHQCTKGAVLANIDPGQTRSKNDPYEGGGFRVGWKYDPRAEVRAEVKAVAADKKDPETRAVITEGRLVTNFDVARRIHQSLGDEALENFSVLDPDSGRVVSAANLSLAA